MSACAAPPRDLCFALTFPDILIREPTRAPERISADVRTTCGPNAKGLEDHGWRCAEVVHQAVTSVDVNGRTGRPSSRCAAAFRRGASRKVGPGCGFVHAKDEVAVAVVQEWAPKCRKSRRGMPDRRGRGTAIPRRNARAVSMRMSISDHGPSLKIQGFSKRHRRTLASGSFRLARDRKVFH